MLYKTELLFYIRINKYNRNTVTSMVRIGNDRNDTFCTVGNTGVFPELPTVIYPDILLDSRTPVHSIYNAIP
jgi:hypothetical protein